VILPPFIPAPKGDWVFWRRGYKAMKFETHPLKRLGSSLILSFDGEK